MKTLGAFLLAFSIGLAGSSALAGERAEVRVYKSPTCGCCTKWIDHLEDHGFAVEALERRDMRPTKREHGIPPKLASCHTALVEGYVIEGHVPAEDVIRLLDERPSAAGLAVPDMPIGSPGMEGPDPEPYSVYIFDDQGRAEVFSSHTP